ncbi:MAG: ribosomal protein S18-alanine N-acetyltransferase [Promethearchaeota archaeon]
MVRVRLVVEQDLKEIFNIERQSFPNPYSFDFFKLLVETCSNWFIVATNEFEKNDEKPSILGYAVANILQWDRGQIGHIISIAIRPENRRKGIGTKLMKELIHRLQNDKCIQVRLEVSTTNRAALEMYKKFGFMEVDFIPNYYIEGGDASVQVLDLGVSY